MSQRLLGLSDQDTTDVAKETPADANSFHGFISSNRICYCS